MIANKRSARIYMKLYGDYHCHLTAEEANDWRRMFRANFQAEVDSLRVQELSTVAHIVDLGSALLQKYYISLRHLEDKVLVATEDWYQEVLAKRKEEAAARSEARRAAKPLPNQGEQE